MTCDEARESISAAVDGELDANDEETLTAHLAICDSCRAYQDDAFALRRALRMRMVDDEPPATSVDIAGSLQGVSVLRWALFVIGGTLVALNVTSIITPDGTAAAHLSRHDGVFGTALGVAMLAVAARPHRAIGLVPLTSTIAVLMAIAAATDLISGNTSPLGEAIHVVEFAGLICLWVISGGPSRLWPRLQRARSSVVPQAARPRHRAETSNDDRSRARPTSIHE